MCDLRLCLSILIVLVVVNSVYFSELFFVHSALNDTGEFGHSPVLTDLVGSYHS